MLDDIPQSTPSPVSSVYSQHQRQPLYSIPPATISGSVVNSSTEQILTEHLLCIRHCCGQRDTAEFKMDETPDPVALTQGWGADITNKQSTYRHLSTSMSLKNIYVHVCMRAWSLQSCLTLCDPRDCSHRAPLSTGLFRQEHGSALPGPPPGDLPNPRIKPLSPASPALAGGVWCWAARVARVCVRALSSSVLSGSAALYIVARQAPVHGILQTKHWVGCHFLLYRTSQVALVAKNPPTHSGDVRDTG